MFRANQMAFKADLLEGLMGRWGLLKEASSIERITSSSRPRPIEVSGSSTRRRRRRRRLAGAVAGNAGSIRSGWY